MTDKAQILIVEDDLDLAEMLNAYFRVQGYEVLTANWGADAVRMSKEHMPNLIVLDIRLPDIDGYEVCRQIRANRRTAAAPVIFLTEKRDRVDKLAGLELGVVDYITKPFDIQELRLRVRNALQRASLTSLMNPITNLPEGTLTDERLNEVLSSTQWAIVSLRLMGMDNFREMYGFVASDDVLRAVSVMINNAMREAGNEGDFLGHLDNFNFVIATTPEKATEIKSKIEGRLQNSMDWFYPLKDRERIEQIPENERLRLPLAIINRDENNLPPHVDEFKKLILRAHGGS